MAQARPVLPHRWETTKKNLGFLQAMTNYLCSVLVLNTLSYLTALSITTHLIFLLTGGNIIPPLQFEVVQSIQPPEWGFGSFSIFLCYNFWSLELSGILWQSKGPSLTAQKASCIRGRLLALREIPLLANRSIPVLRSKCQKFAICLKIEWTSLPVTSQALHLQWQSNQKFSNFNYFCKDQQPWLKSIFEPEDFILSGWVNLRGRYS